MEKNKMITLTNYEIETFVNSLSMNDNDKANLTFLLSIDKDVSPCKLGLDIDLLEIMLIKD
jgi:hypothetical protein